MNTTNNTILITGGGAGIGLEMARLFSEKGNKVIITGRSPGRLSAALSAIPTLTTIVSDASSDSDAAELASTMERDFPSLNIIINNAGRAIVYNLAGENADSVTKAGEEMATNYFSAIRLTEKLLPLLKRQKESAIINVSSISAFVPSHVLPTYSASKAALHSYTQALRVILSRSSYVKVFEIMPPLVDTDFSTEIGGSNGIHPSVVASELLKALERDEYEIHVGSTADLYMLTRTSPAEALKIMNPEKSTVHQ
jgi:uncharacterized oxidoreductase